MSNSKNSTNKKRTPLTQEQKAAMKLKREQNPQFPHIQSKARKSLELATRQNVSLLLIEAKNTLKVVEVIKGNDNGLNILGIEQMQNEELQNDCKKFINFITKKANTNLVELFETILKANDNGLYTVYQVEQKTQKVVKYCKAKNVKYAEAINAIYAKMNKK